MAQPLSKTKSSGRSGARRQPSEKRHAWASSHRVTRKEGAHRGLEAPMRLHTTARGIARLTDGASVRILVDLLSHIRVNGDGDGLQSEVTFLRPVQ